MPYGRTVPGHQGEPAIIIDLRARQIRYPRPRPDLIHPAFGCRAHGWGPTFEFVIGKPYGSINDVSLCFECRSPVERCCPHCGNFDLNVTATLEMIRGRDTKVYVTECPRCRWKGRER